MSIKLKLILSFSIIAVLVALLAGYSIYGVGKSAQGFKSYREQTVIEPFDPRHNVVGMLMYTLAFKDFYNQGFVRIFFMMNFINYR